MITRNHTHHQERSQLDRVILLVIDFRDQSRRQGRNCVLSSSLSDAKGSEDMGGEATLGLPPVVLHEEQSIVALDQHVHYEGVGTAREGLSVLHDVSFEHLKA